MKMCKTLVMRLKKLMSYFEESQSLLDDLKEDLGKDDLVMGDE